MPIYRCHSPQRMLTKSAKANIAGEITRIHCEATGERPSFVNILFVDLPAASPMLRHRPFVRDDNDVIAAAGLRADPGA